MSPRVKVGILPSPQHTTWSALDDIGRRIDAAGYTHLWASDHLYPGHGSTDGPQFEGFMTLASWATSTRRVLLGSMVAANTFRHPALTAKMATTLDHISGGRTILGVGAGWFEAEHQAFGLDFGTSVGDRLDRLEEGIAIIRGMLDGAAPSGDRFYATDRVRNDPPPVQAHLPILIGGGGERRTLAIVARYADIWNLPGTIDEIRHKDAVLLEWCDRVGRDEATVERSYHAGPIFIRDSLAEARELARVTHLVHGEGPALAFAGPPDHIVERIAPFIEAGFRSMYFDLIAPFDIETLERLADEVWPALDRVA